MGWYTPPDPSGPAGPSAPSPSEPPGREVPAGPGEINLRSLLGVLRRHFRLVLGVTLATLALTAFLVQRERAAYRATAVVRLVDVRRTITGGVVEGVPAERRPTFDPILSQTQLIRSRGVVGEVVDALGLRLRPLSPSLVSGLLAEVQIADPAKDSLISLHFSRDRVTARGATMRATAAYGAPLELGGIRFVVSAPPGIDEVTLAVVPREVAIDDLLWELQARPRELTDIVEVSFSSPDPLLAQRVVNGVVETYQALNSGASREQSRRRRLFLEEQLAQNDSILADLQLRLGEFRGQRRIYSSRGKLEAQQSGILGLEVRREELVADRRMYASLLAGLQNAKDDSAGDRLRALIASPGIATNPVITQLYSQLMQYQTEYETLTTGSWASSASNPDAQRLAALVTSTEQKLVSAVRGHIAYLDERVAALVGLQAQNESSLQSLLNAESEELHLAQQLETIRRMGDHLREEYQKARIAEAVDVGQMEIVDRAALPYLPVNSGRALKLFLGLLLGLVMGSGGALLREAVNTSIRRRNDLEGVLHVPTLAVIPQIAAVMEKARGRRLLPARSGAGDATGEGAGGGGGRASGLVTVSSPRSSWAESYRMLRASLLFSQGGKRVRSMVVTSAAPTEGKTMTAANLAVTLAQEGLHVLIADCDLRRARLHKLFRVGKSPGLVQLLQDQVTLEDVLRSTPFPGLDVLPAGLLPQGQTDLLAGARMERLLERLIEMYDLVVLDAPPVLAVADAAVLAALSDGVLLVVRAGKTERGATEQARRQLDLVGARLLGAVLNDPDSHVSRNDDHYYVYDYTTQEE